MFQKVQIGGLGTQRKKHITKREINSSLAVFCRTQQAIRHGSIL